jgi:hypothetical protein
VMIRPTPPSASSTMASINLGLQAPYSTTEYHSSASAPGSYRGSYGSTRRSPGRWPLRTEPMHVHRQ